VASDQAVQEMTGTIEEEAAASGQAVQGTTGAEAVASGQAVQEKCTRQSAQTAIRKQRYHSSHPVTGLYTAGNATRTTDLQKDINLRSSLLIQADDV